MVLPDSLPDVSSVPLTEDVLKEKPKFTPTFLEWLYMRSDQIARSKTATGVIYAVPEGHIFYLTNAFLSVNSKVLAAEGTAFIYVRREEVNNRILALGMKTPSVDITAGVAQNWSFPLRIESGEVITLANLDTDVVVFAGIQGFLIKRTDVDILNF